MLVDDASFMRRMLRHILTAAHYQVVAEAQTGKEALALYPKVKPDLVFVDVIMPDLDGIAIVRAILEQDPEAKVIVCSAMGQQHVVMEAVQAGARDYLVKPFEPVAVVAAVQKVIKAV
jgi:two-component system chemotaxis response regulator CheY